MSACVQLTHEDVTICLRVTCARCSTAALTHQMVMCHGGTRYQKEMSDADIDTAAAAMREGIRVARSTMHEYIVSKGWRQVPADGGVTVLVCDECHDQMEPATT